jgi:hypothetical protein
MKADVLEVIEEYKQWNIGATRPRSGVIPKASFKERPERNYTLKGKVIRKFLQHEKQAFGINLGWTDDAEPGTAAKVERWFFVRNGGGDAPIRYGETIALGNGNDPSFLRYEERTVGINLDWSNTPVFEWKLLGGRLGDPVQLQDWVAIYNEKEKDCLIFFDRTVGGDIGWPTSTTWFAKFKKIVKEEALNALLDGVFA